MPGPGIQNVQKPKHMMVSAKRLLKSLRPWRFRIVLMVVLSIISTGLTIFGPLILGEMTTSATASLMANKRIDWAPIIKLLTILIALYLSSAVIGYIRGIITVHVSARYAEGLRQKVMEKFAKLPMSYFDKVKFGDTLSRMTNDTDVIDETLSQSVTEIVTSLTMVIGILIMMFSISLVLSVIAIITVPIALVIVGKIMGRAQKYFKKQRTILGELNSVIEEDYTGQALIKVNSHGERSLSDFEKTNEKLYSASWKSQFFGGLAFPIVHIFTNLGYVAVCVAGGYMVIRGQLKIGHVQSFLHYTSQFNQPITSVAQILSTIQQTLAAAERIFEFLDEPEESPDIEPALTLSKVRGAVEFNNLKFSYNKEKPIIKDFSCKIEPGMQVAIVGPTGAGKTTIVNLLMRFYESDSGYITIDGVPTREMQRSYLRGLFGMVLQDTWLFSGTIYENLSYGNKKATLEDVKKAAKYVGVHHFIESLPKGYQTVIDEDSDNISAGEKQLLTITRAIVENPPMIILDEATSNVDTRTEELIQEAFCKLTKGRTSFVIAHRLSTIRNADLILVMRDGNIAEKGTHEELLKQNGFYAELYNSQFAEG